MKQKRVCGLDVHKDTVFCAFYDGEKKSEVKEYATFTSSIKEMGNEIRSHGIKEIAMESTGIYWIPIWNVLEDMGFTLTLVNPYQIKQMPGRKSDVKDAQWIASLLHKGMLRGSLVPGKRIRELRTYSRKYVQLQGKITGSLNAMERTLEMSNIRITSLVSNNSGKSVLDVIRKIIKKEDSVEELACCIHKRILNSKGEKVKLSLDGYIQEHHRLLLEMDYEQYELFVKQSQRMEKEMSLICETYYKEEFEILQTLPGAGKQASMQIIAETGADMKPFENSGKLTGWAGLRPRNDESAGKMKSTAITKGNKYLRRIMVQCAWAASRTKESHYQMQFQKLIIRKPRKKALIAIARKQLSVIWNMLYYKQCYDPNKQPVHNVNKLKNRIRYHQKQAERLETLCK
ncbi:MAG: IS110 family transposase [Bacteroidota bacterium]